jgi:ribonucleoside-diphosphate reductase alpha chain
MSNSERDVSRDILSEITIFNKYARFLPEKNRRESWSEIVTRNMEMHIEKFPSLQDEIREAYQYVYDKKVLPSMRSLQFAGKAAKINPARLYNCSFQAINDLRAFNETMMLLLSGVGCGYSVQTHHVDKLPHIRKPNPNRRRRYVIEDSILGWSDAVKVLIRSYFGRSSSSIDFDYREIRVKGSLLVTSGGKAPGSKPLRECLTKIQGLLDDKSDGDKLSTLEAHTIQCYIADAVLSGGIRRAALIALFSIDDTEMLSCKSGNWWELSPHLGRANNSAVVVRSRCKHEDFLRLWDYIKASGSGEPGISWTNNPEMGFNPLT